MYCKVVAIPVNIQLGRGEYKVALIPVNIQLGGGGYEEVVLASLELQRVRHRGEGAERDCEESGMGRRSRIIKIKNDFLK